jgi:phage N-6-adenine-methyltransferase
VSLVEAPLVSSTARNTEGSRDDWETPDWLFDALDREFSFHLDAAATGETTKCCKWISPEEDALGEAPWRPMFSETIGAVWLNPPYGRGVGKWIERAYKESRHRTVVVLTFARTDTRWWHEFAMKASEIRFLRGRVRFLQDGETKTTAPAPSCLLVFTPWSEGPPSIRSMAA